MVALRSTIPIRTDAALIEPLREVRRTREASGFRGVYAHKGGWRGVVKFGGELIRVCPTLNLPSQAAEEVARWFRERLGWLWADLLRAHRRHIWRYAPWKASYDDALGGWTLTVWEWDYPVEVTHMNARGKRLKSRPKVFGSWREAADYVGVWMRRRWGLLHHMALYRLPASSPRPWESKAALAA